MTSKRKPREGLQVRWGQKLSVLFSVTCLAHFQKYMLNKWMNKWPPPPHLLRDDAAWVRGNILTACLEGGSRIRWEPPTASGPEGTVLSSWRARTEPGTDSQGWRCQQRLATKWACARVRRAVHNESRCVNYCILLTSSCLPVHRQWAPCNLPQICS